MPTAPPTPDDDEDAGWLGVLLSVGVAALLTVVVLTIPDLRQAADHALAGDGTALRRQLRDLGAAGVGVLVALMLVHAIVLFPSELVTATAGLVYGFLGALPIVIGGWLLSALLTYWLGQNAGRPLLRKLVGGRHFERAEAAVVRGGAGFLLTARLIPIVPYSLIGYVAGAARVPLFTFVWTTVVGTLPLTLIVVALGTRLEHLSPTDPLVWLAVAPLIVLAFVARPITRRMGL